MVPFTITVDNGEWTSTQTVNVTYNGGTTGCAQPTGLTVANITKSGANVAWSANASATGYDLRYRVVGTADWQVLSATANSAVLSSLVANTRYEVAVRANCNNNTSSAYSPSVTFTTAEDVPIEYCTSSSGNANDEYISRVQLGNIDNASAGGEGYRDYRAISTSLAKGVSNSLTVTASWSGRVYREGYAVWIDYNQDGDFTDAGENVVSVSPTFDSPVTGNFVVPNAASEGRTTMRISMRYNGLPTSCEQFRYGEVEDYSVDITSGAAGSQMRVFAIPSTTHKSARLVPNPATNIISVENAKGSAYSILDALGKVVSTGVLSDGITVDITNLKGGVYFVKVGRVPTPLRFVKQ